METMLRMGNFQSWEIKMERVSTADGERAVLCPLTTEGSAETELGGSWVGMLFGGNTFLVLVTLPIPSLSHSSFPFPFYFPISLPFFSFPVDI